MSGTCTTPSQPTTEVPTGGTIPAHGLCEVALPPVDGEWRGMNHHSQFRCVEIVNSVSEDYQVAASDLYDSSSPGTEPLTFNACGVSCPAGDEDCSADCAGGLCATSSEATSLMQPHVPVFSCTNTAPTAGPVGFVSVRYDSTYPYSAGCIDEWEAWPDLCPGYDPANPLGTIGDGVDNDFGALACGCGTNYGGASCETGCPNVLIDPTYTVSPRMGWWMCGEVSAAGMATEDATYGPAFVGSDSSGTWVMRGTIEVAPRDKTPMCEGGSCGTGWSIE